MAAEEEKKEEVEIPEEAATFEEAWDENPEEVGGEEEPPTDEPGESEEEAEEPKSDEPEKKEESPEEPVEPEIKDDAPAKSEDADEKPSYEKLEQQYRTLKGMYNKAAREIPPEAEEEEPKESFTLDTSAIAEEIEKLPGVAAAIDEHGEEMGAALKDVTGLIVKEFNGILANFTERVEGRFGKISEAVEPIQADHVKSKDEAHKSAIEEEHPDYRKYVDSGELREWVNTHDGIKLDVLNGVMKNGTSSEAIDLITEFREAKGYKESPEEIPAENAKEEIDESKKKKLEDMEAVDTKKTPVSPEKGKGGKDDFESSWDDF